MLLHAMKKYSSWVGGVTHGSYILPLQKNLIVSHFTRNLTEINDISNKETPTYEA